MKSTQNGRAGQRRGRGRAKSVHVQRAYELLLAALAVGAAEAPA